MRRYFVTGTDTGVGKTFVTCALARRARALGQRVFAFKPIETGCELVGGVLVGPDQRALVHAAGGWQRDRFAGQYQFALAAAPLVAAEAEGCTIDVIGIVETAGEGCHAADVVIVEGAGGWRVPITETVDMGGLAQALGFGVVIVARATLGTINHTLLTIEAVQRQATIAAVIMSVRPEDDPRFAVDNAARIKSRSGQAPVLLGPDQVLDFLVAPDCPTVPRGTER